MLAYSLCFSKIQRKVNQMLQRVFFPFFSCSFDCLCLHLLSVFFWHLHAFAFLFVFCFGSLFSVVFPVVFGSIHSLSHSFNLRILQAKGYKG